MSISIFNVQNHRLDGNMLRKLHEFAVSDFCGLFATPVDPAFNGTGTVTINGQLPDPLIFLGWGCLLTVPKSDITGITLDADKIYVLRVSVDFSNDNFTTDVTSHAEVVSFTPTAAQTEQYTNYGGKTILVSGSVFDIPLFSTDSTKKVTSLTIVKDGKSWEEFLTADALQHWMDDADNKYTFKSGSTSSGLGNGKIGNFDFSGNNLRHQGDEFATIFTATQGNKFQFPTYTSGALSVNSASDVVSGTLPVTFGGTGGTTKDTARQGLGIFYGTELPSEHSFGTTVNIGDVYFRILTN